MLRVLADAAGLAVIAGRRFEDVRVRGNELVADPEPRTAQHRQVGNTEAIRNRIFDFERNNFFPAQSETAFNNKSQPSQ
jgi:hypothetical protein